jgi:tryptophan synthase alpha chain
MNRLATNHKMPVMAHLVLGYPTLQGSIDTAKQYIAAGIQTLELQIPFSHPTADGPVITAACREAVENQGVGMSDCFGAIRRLRAAHPDQEIVVMSYINRVFAYGMDAFCREMSASGVRHVIIPDLPVDSALARAFIPAASGNPCIIPVLAANVPDERLEKLLALGFDYFYLMSDFKITGSTFSLNPRLKSVIDRIRHAKPGARIGIGFGISTPEQARLAVGEAGMAIIGSALIKAQGEGRLEAYLETLQGAFGGEAHN